MRVIDCLDKDVSSWVGFEGELGRDSSLEGELKAKTLDEKELLISVANLLYKTKSVRSVIDIIDKQIKSPFNGDSIHMKKIENITFSFAQGWINNKNETFDDNLNKISDPYSHSSNL